MEPPTPGLAAARTPPRPYRPHPTVAPIAGFAAPPPGRRLPATALPPHMPLRSHPANGRSPRREPRPPSATTRPVTPLPPTAPAAPPPPGPAPGHPPLRG